MKSKRINYLVLLIVIAFELIYSQTISIRGKVQALNQAVANALITFVDLNDTINKTSTLSDASGNYSINITTSLKSINQIPTDFELEQNYPNPFSTSTSIAYKLNKENDVQIIIYDILGREVKKFSTLNQLPGTHKINWNGKSEINKKLSAGVYFYRMTVDGKSITKKMIIGFEQQKNFNVPNYLINNFTEITNEKFSKGLYQIRIENSPRTNPTIIPKKFDNISIKKDTILNFSIDKVSPTTTINLANKKQIIRGFGASNILLWRPDMTDSEIQSAFGMNDGQIGFSILRIMLEADSNRWSLYLPTCKKAQSLGATIIASPWFAPNDMVEKVNNVSRVRYDKYADYANHLNSFITFMKKNGVNIYGVSIQNEPDITDQWTSWTQTEMFNFVKNYAHLIKGTYVMAPESFQFRRNMSDPILNDSVACANTDIICGHIYGAGLSSYPLAMSKGKEIWMTEYLFGEQNSANTWSWALKVATNISDVMKADMSAYVWWYIVRYYGPIGDGTYAVQNPNESYPQKGEVTKKGFVMSQFSKFIRPGFYRVETNTIPTLVGDGVDVTAYKNFQSNEIIIVAVNTSLTEEMHTFNFENGDAKSFITYTTSALKNCEKGNFISVVNNSFSFKIEPLSITTFVSN